MSAATPSHHPSHHENAVTSPIEAVQWPDGSQAQTTETRFISLRWRLLLPITVTVMILSMVGAYLISYSLAVGLDEDDLSDVRRNSDTVAAELSAVGVLHQRELFRISNTGGVRENIAALNASRLQSLIQPNLLLANLEIIIITDLAGNEIIALQQIAFNDGTVNYVVLNSSPESTLPFLRDVLNENDTTVSSLISIEEQLYIVSAVSVADSTGAIIGSMTVGTRLESVLTAIEQRDAISLGVYDNIGRTIASDAASDSTISAGIAQQITQNPQTTVIETQVIDGQRYHLAYIPLLVNQSLLGVISVSQPATTAAASMAQHIIGLSAALVMAGVITIGYRGVAKQIERIEDVRDTVTALADGNPKARSNIPPSDEIGQLATALDRYADVMQHRTSALTQRLQSQRRESNRLQSVLESLADGLVILDPAGRMLMTNSAAKQLLGQSENADLSKLLDTITDTLGPLIAPGIHTVGHPTRIAHDGKVLQAQAAAVINDSGKRLGLLATLRDISDDVRREQRYEQLLGELAQEVHLPISYAAQDAALAAAERNAEPTALLNFAREIARNARSLQRIISDLRDLQTFSPEDVERVQQPILVSELLWQLAAQWKPVAKAAGHSLQVQLPERNYYILGDHRRLQWALGNLIDNAIKYSQTSSNIQLHSDEVQDGQVTHIMLTDEGVGIGPEALPHVFKRFFRGQPTTPDGATIHQPGTGQGLYLAKRVIEAHDGDISIESTVGEGTTVHVWLPLTADIAFPSVVELFTTPATPQTNTREYSLVPRVLKRLEHRDQND